MDAAFVHTVDPQAPRARNLCPACSFERWCRSWSLGATLRLGGMGYQTWLAPSRLLLLFLACVLGLLGGSDRLGCDFHQSRFGAHYD
jgi:hypothetical protein